MKLVTNFTYKNCKPVLAFDYHMRRRQHKNQLLEWVNLKSDRIKDVECDPYRARVKKL